MGKVKNIGGSVHLLDRNRASGPWAPLVPFQLPPGAAEQGVEAAFQNNRFRVFVKRSLCGLMAAGPDGQPRQIEVAHLIIAGAGGRSPTYAEVQRIKNELMHEECDACEIYPARSREIQSGQTHIWCLPPGLVLPLGLMPSAPVGVKASEDSAIPGTNIKRGDLQFCVLESDVDGVHVVEVFADHDDARASYSANGLDVGDRLDGTMRMVGAVPTEDEGAAWSQKAMEKRAAISDAVEEAGKRMAEEQVAAIESIRLPNGAASVEDEMAAEGGYVDGPLEPEESAKLEDMMNAGIAKRAEIREADMAAAEADAADSIRRMREELLKRGADRN